MTNPPRIPLQSREDLSIYWDNHLRVAFEHSAPHDLPAMVEASLAHVLMLRETGALPVERADRLLQGLHHLWQEWGPHSDQWTPRHASFPFDGSVEDPYYFLEQQLANACGIDTNDLDVQLARSRNDLDAGVFRMILRRAVLDLGDLIVQCISDLAAKADELATAVIIGNTHRRPAQPTTIGHVLAGLSETLMSQGNDLIAVYDSLNISPLGSAAFTGTDIPIDSDRLAELLGFSQAFTSSYEAVAGAEHFMQLAAVHARITSTGARWARVLQEWMNLGWVVTPTAFTQGSSIMPQKKNPVVLEHMVSMAVAANADLATVYGTIAAGWYEDSNNATTDIQHTLWSSTDRVLRFLRLYDGLTLSLAVGTLPSSADIVRSGATTTAVAEALSVHGVPWRSAHHVVGSLFRAGDPLTWTAAQVASALRDGGISDTEQLVAVVLSSGQHPEQILTRTQKGSPGVLAVRDSAQQLHHCTARLAEQFSQRRCHLNQCRQNLLQVSNPNNRTPSSVPTTPRAVAVIGNANLDIVVHDTTELPPAGTERVVGSIDVRLGGSAALSAQACALLGTPTELITTLGNDDSAQLVRQELKRTPRLRLSAVVDSTQDSPLTVAIQAKERDRSFLSSLGTLATFDLNEVSVGAADLVLCSGYFLLPKFGDGKLADYFAELQRVGVTTAVDTGDPLQGWTKEIRDDLLRSLLPATNYFLPNEAEICGLMDSHDPAAAAQELAHLVGSVVVVKLGSQGAVVASQQSLRHFATEPVSPIDTVGAGDTFNAAFLSAIAHGLDPLAATERAVGIASAFVAAEPSQRNLVLAGHAAASVGSAVSE